MCNKIIFIIFYLSLFISAKGQINGYVKDAIRDTIPVPFASVTLYDINDTTSMITGCITDIDGAYSIIPPIKESFLIKVSSMGYETNSFKIDTYTTGKMIRKDISLRPMNVELGEVVVKGEKSIRQVDRRSFFITKEQIQKAHNSQDVIASLPKMFINRMDNSLKTVDGKEMLILINGVQSTNRDLRLLSPNKIKKVDVFDVPPIQYYNQAEVVINVITEKIESGYSIDTYLQVGQLYESFSPSLSYTHGNNRFTFGYDLHINPKRGKGRDSEGIYDYQINNNSYHYSYEELQRTWNNNHLVNFTYANTIMDSHLFQIKGDVEFEHTNNNETRNIIRTTNNFQECAEGKINGNTKTVNPSLDIYYAKYFSKKSSFAFDLLGTLYSNKQNTLSCESGSYGYEDLLDLNANKSSVIGEMVYSATIGKTTWSTGYKGNFSFLNNHQYTDEADYKDYIKTQKHYFYSEVGGSIERFMYRFSLGINNSRRLGENGFNNTTFMPVALLGYKINENNSLRFKLDNCVTMPNIQQMSDTRILVMRDIYRTGNSVLRNSHLMNWSLNYEYNKSWLNIAASIFLKDNKNSLFNNYVYGKDCIELKTYNSEKNIKEGLDLTFTLTPFDAWVLELSTVPTYEIFQPIVNSRTYFNWTVPLSIYTQYSYKNYTLAYYQKLGNEFIDGIYLEGLEKISFISLEYKTKNLKLGFMMYFPFIKDKYKINTLDGCLVSNSYQTNQSNKNRAIAFTFSWNISKNKKRSSRKLLRNEDDDNGIFLLK